MTPKPRLHLHYPRDNRFGLDFITGDKQQRARRISELSSGSDIELATVEEAVDGSIVHLVYTRTPFEAAYPSFESTDEVLTWFDHNFSSEDKQVLFTVVEIFDGIISEKEAQGSGFSTYKRMEWEGIPEVLNRVQWRQSVPEVGAELLSRFVLRHPLSNTNHRTGIGLLDRYLSTYHGEFVMPETGEEAHWYEWAREYIHDSKRILTLRTQLPLLYWAHEYGYDVAERKEGIRIDLTELDLARDDYRNHFTNCHLDRSHEFVETVLDEAEAPRLRETVDDGKRAFADRLRANR